MEHTLKFEQPILVTQSKLPPLSKYTNYLEQIWESKWLTNNGKMHEELKAQLRNFLEVQHTELFTNGHLALEIAIRSLELSGEVITTPFTFASTTHAIVNSGLTPVFCDIDPVTFNIDANKIEELITDKTSAIVAVHVFGTPCDVEKIEQIAEKHNLKIIYDAAHAFGVYKNETAIGNFGDISMFSLHATKVFHSIEGGLLTYQDDTISAKLKSLKNFGLTDTGSVEYIGINAKMNEFQAAMGLCNLETIEQDIDLRGKAFSTYTSLLEKQKDIQILIEDSSVKRNFAYFPIVLKNEEQRDRLHDTLKFYNVYARKYFYPTCNSFECYDFDPTLTPIALDISKRVLCLPMYSELSVEEAKQISQIIIHELGEINGEL